ncbi:alpha/beta fold hydrolase [Thiomicrospira microaerophila]|uniref:alpha/beta fold hydrolase n=1 Tax=Thiomicrospira microaerophila TaxID=406020 RepID=UPI000698EB23|nr:alpha/beta hydrolase [Thiomicrospira microaerophila]
MFLLAWLGLHTLVHAGYPQPASSFISDNQRLHYHVLGDGHHTVLILGGGPGFSSWNLTPIQQHLAQGYRVLLMDMRGIGENRHVAFEANQLLNQWVEDIEALRRYEQAGQFILVGHSWGALMAQLYARQHPNRIARLVLINPVDPQRWALQNLVQRIDYRRQLDGLTTDADEWAQHETQDTASLIAQQLTQVMPTYFLDIEQGKHYAKQFSIDDFSLHINHAIWQQYQQNPIEKSDLEALAKRRPIELINCQHDLLMPEALLGYQDFLTDIANQTLDNCAHFPWEENPTDFYSALDRAMNTNPPEDDFSDLSDADRAWLLDDSGLDDLVKALAATQTDVRFLAPFDLSDHYSMTNDITLTEQSLETGWADLIQCHHNLDAVGQLQIVYNPQHTRQIEILSQQHIAFAWVEGASVQMVNLQQGAQICIHAQTWALQKLDKGYLIERGPFMRRFLDGYFPMHVELTINWPDLSIKTTQIVPEPQPGLVVKTDKNALQIDYYFQGQLKPQIYLNTSPRSLFD